MDQQPVKGLREMLADARAALSARTEEVRGEARRFLDQAGRDRRDRQASTAAAAKELADELAAYRRTLAGEVQALQSRFREERSRAGTALRDALAATRAGVQRDCTRLREATARARALGFASGSWSLGAVAAPPRQPPVQPADPIGTAFLDPDSAP